MGPRQRRPDGKVGEIWNHRDDLGLMRRRETLSPALNRDRAPARSDTKKPPNRQTPLETVRDASHFLMPLGLPAKPGRACLAVFG